MPGSKNIFLDIQAMVENDESDSEGSGEGSDLGFLEEHDTGNEGSGLVAAKSYHKSVEESGAEHNKWQEFVDRAKARANFKRSYHMLENDTGDNNHGSPSTEALEEVSERVSEDVMRIFNFCHSSTLWPWARVRGDQKRWRRYAGDTGLITKIDDGKDFLALIPRLSSNDTGDHQPPPPQALASRGSLDNRKVAKSAKDGRYISNGQMFTADGLLLINMRKIGIHPFPEALPTFTELALFRSTSLLSDSDAEKIQRRLAQAHMKLGDRVKVTSGPYLNLLGEIRELKDGEAAVYIFSQDVVEDMPKYSVRAAFEIGDQIRVVDGEFHGFLGWVIGVSEGTLSVLNDQDSKEVIVSKSNVEFYSPDHIIGLQPRCSQDNKLVLRNPNDVYISKRVMVIGNHEFKGYKGHIKSTTTDGHAFLQLDSRLQKTIKVRLRDLACLTYADRHYHRLLTGKALAIENNWPPYPEGSLPFATPRGGLTPAWDSAESSHIQPGSAWDPLAPLPASPFPHSDYEFQTTPPAPALPSVSLSSSTPSSPVPMAPAPPHSLSSPSQPLNPQLQPPVPLLSPDLPRPWHWLDDPKLHNLRLKLRVTNPSVQSPYVEFLRIENNLVKVRDKTHVKCVPFESVYPLLPEAGGDLVVPKHGEKQGVHFRIIRIKNDICAVRKPGVIKPTRKNPDYEFAISDLVQVYPALRRT